MKPFFLSGWDQGSIYCSIAEMVHCFQIREAKSNFDQFSHTNPDRLVQGQRGYNGLLSRKNEMRGRNFWRKGEGEWIWGTIFENGYSDFLNIEEGELITQSEYNSIQNLDSRFYQHGAESMNLEFGIGYPVTRIHHYKLKNPDFWFRNCKNFISEFWIRVREFRIQILTRIQISKIKMPITIIFLK